MSNDPINPNHYKSHPSGVECIQITQHFNFNKGNAIKYIWRSGEKDCEIQDLRKAIWYLENEIKLIGQKRLKCLTEKGDKIMDAKMEQENGIS